MVWWTIIIIGTLFVSFFGMIINVLTKHANKHPEAQSVRDAFYKNGYIEIWQEKIDRRTFHYIVKMDDGTYGDWVVLQDNGSNIEKTVMLPKHGNLNAIRNWLKPKATKI